jgi:hypothetical protein
MRAHISSYCIFYHYYLKDSLDKDHPVFDSPRSSISLALPPDCGAAVGLKDRQTVEEGTTLSGSE